MTPDPLQTIWAMIQLKAALLVVVAVVIIGYLLKLIPKWNNDNIPWVVIPSSILLYGILCVPPASSFDTVSDSLRYLVTTAILGALVGLIAWGLHARILKRILDAKIPALNQDEPPKP